MTKNLLITAGVLGCAALLLALGYDVAADEPARSEWTREQTARGYVVFSHSTLQRLKAQTVPPREAIVDRIKCSLARREYESLQFGVHAIGADLKDVVLEIESDLPVKVYHGGNGEVDEQGERRHPARETGVLWEGGDIVLYAGGAVPHIAAGKSVNFWLTFHATPQTPAGVHEGKIRVSVQDKASTEINLQVRVRPFQLNRPRIPFGLYFPDSNWPQHTRTDEQWTAIFRAMAEHGETSIALYDYTPWMEVTAGERGTLRYLRLAEPTGLLHPDIPWVWLFGGGFDYVENGKKHKGDVRSHARAVDWYRAERQKRNWPELVFYGWDEPHYPDPRLRRRWLAFRDVPMRLATALNGRGSYGYSDLHDVWIVHAPDITPELVAESRRVGAQVWMYSCVIRSWEVLRERYLAGIFSWANKVGGSFLWAGGGYAQFWWPQEGQGPLPMVGYEARRDGVEDYRYLQMLEDCVAANPDDRLAVEAGAWLEAMRLHHNMNPHEVEPGKPLAIEQYDQIRDRAADYIERLGPVPEDQLKPQPVTHLKDEAKPLREASVGDCIAALRGDNTSQRRAAAWALYERGGLVARAVDALADTLDDPEVRMVALRALEAIGPQAAGAVPRIAALLSHPDTFVRLGATMALGAIGAYAIEPEGRHQTPPPAPSPAADAVIDPLRVAMMDRSSDVSYAAGQMISRLGPVSLRALPEAIELLDHPAGGRRGAAFTLVANLGPQAAAAVPKLIRIIDAKKGSTTGELTVLAAIGPAAAEAVPVLEKWAADKAPNNYRSRLHFTLFHIRGHTADLENFVRFMEDRDLPDWLMLHQVGMLEALGASAAPVAPQLRQLIDSGKYPKSKEAFEDILEKMERGQPPRRMMP